MKDIEVVVNVLCFGSEYMPHDKNNISFVSPQGVLKYLEP